MLMSCGSNPKEEVQQFVPTLDTTETLVTSIAKSPDSFQHLVEDFESPKRNEWQNPALILASLGDLENKLIADIGAGTGYFTFKIAQQGAKVLAIDIEQQFLDYIEERKTELSNVIAFDKVETLLSIETDPLLPESGVDGALLVNTYHFIDNRVDYMTKVKNGLKENGTLVVVDYKIGDLPVGPESSFKISASLVKEELSDAGFKDIKLDEQSLEYQYLIIAKR